VQSPATLCVAVPLPRMPWGGDHFEHTQRQRCGLAFAQHARQHAVDAVGSSTY